MAENDRSEILGRLEGGLVGHQMVVVERDQHHAGLDGGPVNQHHPE